jgi:hypothetical protein
MRAARFTSTLRGLLVNPYRVKQVESSHIYGVVFYSGCLRVTEHRLRVFENRVLRRIFRPKRGEVTGGWRKLHNEELHNSYSSPNIIRTIIQGG